VLSYTYIACLVTEKTVDIKHIQLLGGGGNGTAAWGGRINILNEKKKICSQLIFIYYAKYREIA